MIALEDIARLDEARCALGSSEVAREAMLVAGGVACRDEPKSWVNTCVAIGLRGGDVGVVTPEDVARITAWYHEQGHEARIEISVHAHSSAVKCVCDAGYRVKMFETTFFRQLRSGEAIEALVPLGEGIELAEIDPHNDAMCRAMAVCVNEGFAEPGTTPRESDIQISMRCMKHPRTRSFGAFVNDRGVKRCVAGSYLEVLASDELVKLDSSWASRARTKFAALFGAAVHADYRKRGIQQALLALRMREATKAGASFATIGGLPGAGTERNVRRMGFQVACSKVHFVKACG